ncbi:MAG: FkbM family methyltransferase, partial [Brevinematales bacterium]
FSAEQARASVKDGFRLIGEIRVDAGSLEDLFKQYSEGEGIAFLSVDTEGFDLQVLESNNWEKYRPAVLCIEKGSDPAVLKLMEKSGYAKISETHINTIFILKQDN